MPTIDELDVSAGGVADRAISLAVEDARLEVWPRFGFNALRWQVAGKDVLFVDPNWPTAPVPTRSGHPILFPFPNRLENATFEFDGSVFRLPKNESSGVHAIHGFTPKNAWRTVDRGTAADFAFVTGEFRLSIDKPEVLAYWPSDGCLRVTYTLHPKRLDVAATVSSFDRPLPFGLGYHPYFAMQNSPGAGIDDWTLRVPAGEVWEAVGAIPTGRRLTPPESVDFRMSRRIGNVELDTLYTDLPEAGDGLVELASLSDGTSTIRVSADRRFRELLLFIPAHRKAVAIEPYTCATNAANLPDGGWLVLKPNSKHESRVSYDWSEVR